MKGPMDEEIDPGEPQDDKARKRLEEFVGRRYPGGIPPESSPVESPPTETPSEPKHTDKKKTKRRG